MENLVFAKDGVFKRFQCRQGDAGSRQGNGTERDLESEKLVRGARNQGGGRAKTQRENLNTGASRASEEEDGEVGQRQPGPEEPCYDTRGVLIRALHTALNQPSNCHGDGVILG